MKKIIKRIFSALVGSRDITLFKLAASSLVTSCILFLFALAYSDSFNSTNPFSISSAFFFSIWLVATKGASTLDNFLKEFLRLILFLIMFIFSGSFFTTCSRYSGFGFLLCFLLSCAALYLCSYYFISKLCDILAFTRNVFAKAKLRLFNTDKPAATKGRALVENVTAFLVSIGGLAIAFRTIMESVFQVLDYFK